MASSFFYRGLTSLTEESATGQISNAQSGPRKEIADDLNKRETTILFFGDMMLDRQVRKLISDNRSCSYPFSLVDPFLDGADLKIANLEGPITGNASVSLPNNGMRFTQPIECLSDLGSRFHGISLANNHIVDFGAAGFNESKKNLQMAGIGYFGDYNNSAGTYYIREVKGIKIALIGWNEFSRSGTGRVISDIERVRQEVDFVVVMPHWGEEYELLSGAAQKRTAEEFIKAGADLIIGAHTHVIQDIGEIDGKLVFYSLGNFVFDQYFQKDVTEGLAVSVTLEKTAVGLKAGYKLIPLKITTGSQPYVMDKIEAEVILERLSASPGVTDIMRAEIARGEINSD